jgi:uncharacterized membrane protein
MSDERKQLRHHPAWVRLVVVVLFGLAVGIVVGILTGTGYGLAAGWVAGSGLYIAWVWVALGRLDAQSTRQHATREDPGRTIGEIVVLAASIASLGAVVLLLIRAHQVHGAAQGIAAGMALLTVASSWVVIHTRYMLRYARLYYTEPIGGIDFHGPVEEARYVDFGYLAFDLGQTFQISDTDLLTSRLRSVVLRHTLLSYVFSTAVLATTINLVASLG